MTAAAPLLILGASARAAAQSAARAGLRPSAVDLFADLDLAACASSCLRVEPRAYPDGLESLATQAPPSPWIYTGGLENHPDLVDRIARARPLWGNPGNVLRSVRDPLAVADALARAGLPCPAVRLDPAGLPRDGSWLAKPLASAGGRRIRPWLADSEPPPWPGYFQERVLGPSLAAVFVGQGGESALLGVTRQRLGGLEGEFAYRGSLGPAPVPESGLERIGRVGAALASAFGLAGLFGVDLVWRDGWPWPVEVNPRYTASMEVLELATGRSLMAEHVRAFDPGLAAGLRTSSAPAGFVGKAFVMAAGPCRFPRVASRWVRSVTEVPRRADIPSVGERFEAGQPVLTVFARGPTLEECERRLERRAALWNQRLGRSEAGSIRDSAARSPG